MAVALEKFVKQLEDSGIVAPGKLENFVPPKAHPKDAEELARQLVKADHLTPFQAHHVLNGKVKALFLGNYTVLDKIGAGGMGQVFKAEHRRMKRVVAIKMLPPAVTKDALATARFQREVEVASKLLHPNIVSAFDADEANGAHFMVMEYVEGKDLSAHVKKNGPFSVAKAVNYILQAARGLEFAHGEGVIHRDIKPANLLLDKKGVVKILDMGLARIDAAGGNVAAQAELTGTGAIMGTVDYMAPEQGVSTKDADARADIYSLGCTLYYLLIGKPVYGGETVGAKLVAHHNEPIPDLGALRDDVPQQVNAIFRRMMAKKVEDRYQAMTDVIGDLQACGVGHEQSLTMQRSISSNLENSALTFLKNIPAATTHKPKPTKKVASANSGNGNGKKKLIYGAVGAGLLGLLILAGIIASLRTEDGTLTVEVDQPNAIVQVLDEQGKVEVSQKGGVGKITIGVDPGKHRVQVEKDGFTVFGENFEMESGGRKAITAKLVLVKVVAASTKLNQLWNTPAFQQWIKDVQGLPAGKQVEAVSKKLMELNPGFDGKVTPKFESGVVAEFGLRTENITDISPVCAFVRLSNLTCWGDVGRSGKLSDLSPLEGMKLTKLAFTNTQVSRLSPLQGMPLVYLGCSETNVVDLSPLTGMKLETLGCRGTPVSDLSPLKGMPLVNLHCSRTAVFNLSPLQECKSLRVLHVSNTKVTQTGVAALQKALPHCQIEWPVEGQFYGHPATAAKPITNINDPAFQQWVKATQALPAEQQIEAVRNKLQELNPGFDGKVTGNDGKGTPKIEGGVVTELGFLTDNVIDISPVRALAGLKSLSSFTVFPRRGKLSDLSPLQGMKLTKLRCSDSQVANLSPLQGMPLTQFDCGATNVFNLTPLKGMPLTRLWCSMNQVSDLLPLTGMRITDLSIHDTPVSDLSPLQGMPLSSVNSTHTQVSNLSPLEDCKHLKSLNVTNTKVTPAAVAALQKALPNCKIDWDDPAKATAPVIPGTK